MIVTRYFGGTKLGVGGLVRAYGGSTATALDLARIVDWVAMTDIAFAHPYPPNDAIERSIRAAGAATLDCRYGENVQRVVRVPEHALAALARAISDATAGEVEIFRGS